MHGLVFGWRHVAYRDAGSSMVTSRPPGHRVAGLGAAAPGEPVERLTARVAAMTCGMILSVAEGEHVRDVRSAMGAAD